MIVITYIDGFNLYHSLKELHKNHKNLEYLKWQDLCKLSHMFLSRNDTNSIKFFTAYPKWKPDSHIRHKNYVKILEDMGINVILGHFKEKEVYCMNCKQSFKKHEEKQTDVNIAMHIIRDIYEEKPDAIQLISGDTDLIPPLRMAKQKGVKIHVVIPYNRNINHFTKIANKHSRIALKHLKQCFIGASYATSTGDLLQCPYTINI